jgi:hypothetical protein
MDGVIYFLLGVSLSLNVICLILFYYYNKGRQTMLNDMNDLNETLLNGMMTTQAMRMYKQGQA